ncbi:hypothetical protein CNYM01_10351 [Colletotrichum nymphaeae SA-01]|uniref:SRR1-like domain-containing protein n=1 Tax=Colletotrichum nymphaeae SA-01 TaxID=1460502 RepID=A0A135RU89_9PEZI|nr:hypothetical protein CNYM01_10351 [Colletotrichum nymphaeae SA-01]
MENRRFPENCTCFLERDLANKILSKAEQADVVQTIQHLYGAGAPLFKREHILYLDEAIRGRHEHVNLGGMDGSAYEPRIGFRTIQKMINGVPPDGRMRTWGAFSAFRIACFPRHTAPFSQDLLSKSHQLWALYQDLWKRSPTCLTLMLLLDRLPPQIQVTKIVCFGLGALLPNVCRTCQDCQRSPDCQAHRVIRSRTFTQHAAAVSMMQKLRQQVPHLEFYSQEPEYSPECRVLLNQMGIRVLDGHRGFLEVDDKTLIFSIKPAVPVKQIITELARPAMIIWDAMGGDERNDDERNPDKWQLLTENGERLWHSPFGVDPDSSRTRKMLGEEYLACPFLGDRLNFGQLDIHIRRSAREILGGSAPQTPFSEISSALS